MPLIHLYKGSTSVSGETISQGLMEVDEITNGGNKNSLISLDATSMCDGVGQGGHLKNWQGRGRRSEQKQGPLLHDHDPAKF